MRNALLSRPDLSVLTTILPDNARHTISVNLSCASRKLCHFGWPTRAAQSLQNVQFAIFGHLAALLLVTAGSATLRAEGWVDGPAFVQRLDRKVSATWQETPLGDALRRLGESQSVAVFIDRRVDPSVRISIDLQDVGLRDAFRKIARQQHQKLGIGFCGPVVYIGPPLTTARIATLAARNNERARRLPDPWRRKMLARRALQWPRLSEPRWIMRKLCAESGLDFPAAGSIPHDLWLSGDYPKMTMAERLTLVLAGFGYGYQLEEDTGRLRLTSFPQAVSIEREYELSPSSPKIEELTDRFPQAFLAHTNGKTTIRSTLEDHWAIERLLGMRREPPQQQENPNNQRYTLNVKDKPLKSIVELIGKRLGIEVRFADNVDTNQQTQRISFNVKEATRQQLFDAIVRPAGLSARLQDNRLLIAPRD